MRPTDSALRMATFLVPFVASACGDDGAAPPPTEAGSEGGAESSDTASNESGNVETTGSETDGGSDASSTGRPGSSEGAAGTDDSTGEPACDAFELPGDAFYPEGIAAVGPTLYVGSLATGEVVRVDDCGAAIDSFIAPGDLVRNAVGLRGDPKRDLLWVCNSDVMYATPPSLDAFDLGTGERVATHPFDAIGFCNDIALDDEGNVYATDSAGHRVHRVASADALADTVTETWLTDPAFVVGQGEFGLNGIAFDPGGALWVSNYQLGELYRVAIADDGTAGTLEVRDVDGGLPLPDGVLWHDSDLLVVTGGSSVSRLTLDNPVTQALVGDGLDFGTTVAVSDGAAWVPEGQLDHLFGLDPSQPALPFVVQRIEL